ncbi:hypothetical protein [Acetobacter senegalensis]|uniref:hypothetical protein n=1 Tax=Acetobacter senegalensis TaxID=446692 RepID=UPI0026507D7D|nr:hypothetical protein [Acetobacter senegalensis]MDN7356316.1 hypothetical protein [Acetobacter senegalensis]
MANFLWGANGEEVTPEEIATRKQIAQSLLTQANQTPANYWTQGVSNMVNALMGGFMQGRAMQAEDAHDDWKQEQLDKYFPKSGGNPSASTSPNQDLAQALTPKDGAPISSTPVSPVATALVSPSTPVGQVAQQGALDAITQNVMDHLKRAESGGRIDAKNPNSSASGPYQIINSTAEGIRRNHPELGLTPGWQTDPNQVEIGAKAGVQDNLTALLAKGIHPTEGQIYQSWFTNPRQTSQIAQADPNAPISSILTPAQIRANPFLSNMTVGDFGNWSAQKMGQTGATAPAQSAPAAQPQPAPSVVQAPQSPGASGFAGASNDGMPSTPDLVRLMADPRTDPQMRAVLSPVLKSRMEMQQLQARQAIEDNSPDAIARRDYYRAQTDHLRMPAKQGPEWVDLTPQEVAQSGRPSGQGWQRNLTTGEIRATAKTPLVNVNTAQKAEDALGIDLAKGKADTINTAAKSYEKDKDLLGSGLIL